MRARHTLSAFELRPEEGFSIPVSLTWERLLSMSMLAIHIQPGCHSHPAVCKDNGGGEFRNTCRAPMEGSEKQGGAWSSVGKDKRKCVIC